MAYSVLIEKRKNINYLDEITTASFQFLSSRNSPSAYYRLYSPSFWERREINLIPRKSFIITICGVDRSVWTEFISICIKLR
jgi:hypothetical protein